MCQASGFVSSFKQSKNKHTILNNIKKCSTFKVVGDDSLNYFDDGSILIHRKIVDEIQLFKAAN